MLYDFRLGIVPQNVYIRTTLILKGNRCAIRDLVSNRVYLDQTTRYSVSDLDTMCLPFIPLAFSVIRVKTVYQLKTDTMCFSYFIHIQNHSTQQSIQNKKKRFTLITA
jgi:hypothetical protein